MNKIEGLSSSCGIAIGPVFCYRAKTSLNIPQYIISPQEALSEWERFTKAVDISLEEIALLRKGSNKEQDEILGAQEMMLKDPEFIPLLKKELLERLINIEAILDLKVNEATALLRSTEESLLADRAIDIEDAFGRVMAHLLTKTGSSVTSRASSFVPPNTILVAKNLLPSEALPLRDSGIIGIVLEEGGATSHVAILARSWGLPAIMGARDILEKVRDGEQIILDAHDGFIITQATKQELVSYQQKLETIHLKQKDSENEHACIVQEKAETKDGVLINLKANIADAFDASQALQEGADGIGLFRTEFLFLNETSLPSEEKQTKIYSEITNLMAGKPVVIRTLDAGADKKIAEQNELSEKNPLLGWRAVRYCLDRRDVFKDQLRALLRASVCGDLRIMFPMIANVEELDAVLDVLEEAKTELRQLKTSFNEQIKIGIMIEIPSAAVCADLLAQKVDFMSIGTNDLIQYTLAVDRENPKVSHLYDGFNPAVLRLIQHTLRAGENSKTEVSMCGEMAGDPASVFLLLGLGLTNFSMSASLLTAIKKLIRSVSVTEAKELAQSALKLSAAREIRKLVQEKLKTYE